MFALKIHLFKDLHTFSQLFKNSRSTSSQRGTWCRAVSLYIGYFSIAKAWHHPRSNRVNTSRPGNALFYSLTIKEIADIQAHSGPPIAVLHACRSAIFWKIMKSRASLFFYILFLGFLPLLDRTVDWQEAGERQGVTCGKGRTDRESNRRRRQALMPKWQCLYGLRLVR